MHTNTHPQTDNIFPFKKFEKFSVDETELNKKVKDTQDAIAKLQTELEKSKNALAVLMKEGDDYETEYFRELYVEKAKFFEFLNFIKFNGPFNARA